MSRDAPRKPQGFFYLINMARRFYFTDGSSIEINEDQIEGVYLLEFFKESKLVFSKEINHYDLLTLISILTEFK